MSDISSITGAASSQRLLKAVVIGLGVLIVIALGFVALGMAGKFQQLGGDATAANRIGRAFALPKNAHIVEMQSQTNRLILRLKTADGEEIDIVDSTDGHLVARIR